MQHGAVLDFKPLGINVDKSNVWIADFHLVPCHVHDPWWWVFSSIHTYSPTPLERRLCGHIWDQPSTPMRRPYRWVGPFQPSSPIRRLCLNVERVSIHRIILPHQSADHDSTSNVGGYIGLFFHIDPPTCLKRRTCGHISDYHSTSFREPLSPDHRACVDTSDLHSTPIVYPERRACVGISDHPFRPIH